MIDLSDFFFEAPERFEDSLKEVVQEENTNRFTDPIYEVRSVSAGPDDGSNEVSARYWSPCKRHKTIVEAFNNIRLMARKAEPYPNYAQYNHRIVLDGHGSPGGFDCGSGNLGYGTYNRISLRNIPVWGEELFHLQRDVYYIGQFIMYSCDTGAEEAGAKLVWELSLRFGQSTGYDCNVYARTGTMWYEERGRHIKQHFEKGSTWQSCSGSPMNPPKAIPRPSHSLINNFRLDTFADISHDLQFDLETIVSIEFIRDGTGGKVSKSYEGDTISELRSLLFASPLFHTNGEPAAFVTAEIVLKAINGEILLVRIYNDRIAVIREKQCAFFVSNGLAEF